MRKLISTMSALIMIVSLCSTSAFAEQNDFLTGNWKMEYSLGGAVIAEQTVTIYPDIADDWHPIKNGTLSPGAIAVKSSKKVWWLGKCGHEWQSTVASRTSRNGGCPYCSNKKILKGFNDLETINPDLAKADYAECFFECKDENVDDASIGEAFRRSNRENRQVICISYFLTFPWLSLCQDSGKYMHLVKETPEQQRCFSLSISELWGSMLQMTSLQLIRGISETHL